MSMGNSTAVSTVVAAISGSSSVTSAVVVDVGEVSDEGASREVVSVTSSAVLSSEPLETEASEAAVCGSSAAVVSRKVSDAVGSGGWLIIR